MDYLSICFCCLWFLSLVSYNFCVQLFVSLGKFIPRHFIFCCNGEWNRFLICPSDFSLLVYRNASDFCVLILYPETLLNSLISSSNFLIPYFGFSMYSHVACKQWALYLFFSDLDSLCFFFFLIAVAKTSRAMLNNSGESGHPCLIPDLVGKLSVE